MNVLAGLGLLDENALWQVGRDNPLKVLGKTTSDLPPGRIAYVNGRFEEGITENH